MGIVSTNIDTLSRKKAAIGTFRSFLSCAQRAIIVKARHFEAKENLDPRLLFARKRLLSITRQSNTRNVKPTKAKLKQSGNRRSPNRYKISFNADTLGVR